MTRRFGRVLTTLLLFGALVPIPAMAQQPLGSLTLGLAFHQLTDQLQQAINNAREVGSSVAIEAGRQAALAIENAKNAYADSLDKTVSTLDPTIKNTVDQLKSLVDGVSTATNADLDSFTKRAQTLVNSLPFRAHEPQVMDALPRFIVPANKAYPVLFSFKGNFEFAAKPGFEPELSVGSHKYKANAVTTQELKFLVPVQDVFSELASTNATKFAYQPLGIAIPWEQSAAAGVINHRIVNQYALFVGALPMSPGKIVLTHSTSHTEHHERPFESGDFHQASTREGGNDDIKGRPYLVTPDAGWHVIRGTSSFFSWVNQGDWSWGFGSDDADRVVYYVTTIHHGPGSSGSVDFKIRFNQYQDVATAGTATETIDLKWGDTRTFNYPAGTWKLAFDAFDGTHSEFAGSDATSSKYLKLTNQSGQMQIATADPAMLNFP